MKAKFGISIAAGALAVGLAGTALAGEPAAHEGQQALPGSEPGAQQVQPDPGYGGQQAQLGPDYGEQESDYGKPEAVPSHPSGIVPAPGDAFEISVSTGYTQGFGNLAEGMRVGKVADAGFALGLNLSYRVSPMFSIGVAAQGQVFDPDNELGKGARVRGMTTGLDATFHLAPYRLVDPYISLGTGYRLLWAKSGQSKGESSSALIHGFQIARLNLGADVRVSKDVAIGPMIGADLNTFVWVNPSGALGNLQIKDKGVSTFIYAGLQGRFDVSGTRKGPME